MAVNSMGALIDAVLFFGAGGIFLMVGFWARGRSRNVSEMGLSEIRRALPPVLQPEPEIPVIWASLRAIGALAATGLVTALIALVFAGNALTRSGPLIGGRGVAGVALLWTALCLAWCGLWAGAYAYRLGRQLRRLLREK
jgi:hypothetical protein